MYRDWFDGASRSDARGWCGPVEANTVILMMFASTDPNRPRNRPATPADPSNSPAPLRVSVSSVALWLTVPPTPPPASLVAQHLLQREFRGVVAAHAVDAAAGWRGGRT